MRQRFQKKNLRKLKDLVNFHETGMILCKEMTSLQTLPDLYLQIFYFAHHNKGLEDMLQTDFLPLSLAWEYSIAWLKASIWGFAGLHLICSPLESKTHALNFTQELHEGTSVRLQKNLPKRSVKK